MLNEPLTLRVYIHVHTCTLNLLYYLFGTGIMSNTRQYIRSVLFIRLPIW